MNKSENLNFGFIVYYALSFILWGTYLYLTLTTPINRTSPLVQDVSDLQIRLIQLSVVVPVFLTWLLGLYGGIRLNKYSTLIKEGGESRGLRIISFGILALVLGLAINQVTSALRSLFINDASAIETVIIAANYIRMLVTIIPFGIMLIGSRILLKAMNINAKENFKLFFPAFSLVVTAGLYLLMYVLDPSRQTSISPNVTPTYYLPDTIVILTIVLPYFIAWWMGFIAVINMQVYLENINGVVYKKSFELFLAGFATIVLTSIVFQIVSTTGSRLIQLGLGPILILIYILIAILASGYVIIALGARKLDKIETV